jgi:hypothetical protein
MRNLRITPSHSPTLSRPTPPSHLPSSPGGRLSHPLRHGRHPLSTTAAAAAWASSRWCGRWRSGGSGRAQAMEAGSGGAEVGFSLPVAWASSRWCGRWRPGGSGRARVMEAGSVGAEARSGLPAAWASSRWCGRWRSGGSGLARAAASFLLLQHRLWRIQPVGEPPLSSPDQIWWRHERGATCSAAHGDAGGTGVAWSRQAHRRASK